jgi:hypothetical protein
MSIVLDWRDSVPTSSYLYLLSNHGLNLFPGQSHWFKLHFHCSMWMGFRIDRLLAFVIAFSVVDPFLAEATSFWIEVGVL